MNAGHGRIWQVGTDMKCNCLVCGEAPAVLHFRAKTKLIPTAYRITEEDHTPCWDIWRCTRCGFVFSDWKLTDDQLKQLYASMEDELYDREEETRRLTFRGGLSLIDHTRNMPPKGRLMDIGCATGGFLFEARQRGWDVAGVELSAWAARRANTRNLNVYEGTVHSYPDGSASFDVITMLDYIEHDPEPGLLLDRIRTLLGPGGLVYITTPDIGGFVARMLRAKWWGINPLHLHYFSQATMKKLLEKHGYDVVISRTYTRVFTIGYWASRLEHFSPALGRATVKFFTILGLADKQLKLNLGDMMEVVARKRA